MKKELTISDIHAMVMAKSGTSCVVAYPGRVEYICRRGWRNIITGPSPSLEGPWVYRIRDGAYMRFTDAQMKWAI